MKMLPGPIMTPTRALASQRVRPGVKLRLVRTFMTRLIKFIRDLIIMTKKKPLLYHHTRLRITDLTNTKPQLNCLSKLTLSQHTLLLRHQFIPSQCRCHRRPSHTLLLCLHTPTLRISGHITLHMAISPAVDRSISIPAPEEQSTDIQHKTPLQK